MGSIDMARRLTPRTRVKIKDTFDRGTVTEISDLRADDTFQVWVLFDGEKTDREVNSEELEVLEGKG